MPLKIEHWHQYICTCCWQYNKTQVLNFSVWWFLNSKVSFSAPLHKNFPNLFSLQNQSISKLSHHQTSSEEKWNHLHLRTRFFYYLGNPRRRMTWQRYSRITIPLKLVKELSLFCIPRWNWKTTTLFELKNTSTPFRLGVLGDSSFTLPDCPLLMTLFHSKLPDFHT